MGLHECSNDQKIVKWYRKFKTHVSEQVVAVCVVPPNMMCDDVLGFCPPLGKCIESISEVR
jgi:hypothetical protein